MSNSLKILPTGTIVRGSGKSQFFDKSQLILVKEEGKLPGRDIASSSSARFPRFQECAHFHYELVSISGIKLTLLGQRFEVDASKVCRFYVLVSCGDHGWTVKRSFESICKVDELLHQCVYSRSSSLLPELRENLMDRFGNEECFKMLGNYINILSSLLLKAADLLTCGPVLAWLEVDNKGKHASFTESSLNVPAVGAAHVVKSYVAQDVDELTFDVGDIISIIDKPLSQESTWWQGKKDFKVGYFPSECVQLITGSSKSPNVTDDVSWTKPVLKKRGKFVAFLRDFFISRPNKIHLKSAGIVKERLFGCDLGEHLSSCNEEVPMIVTSCIKLIEEKGIVDGIYRHSGVASNVQMLRNEFDAGNQPDLHTDRVIQDLHCVSSLLKMYFRELPNPLLTHQLYDRFLEIEMTEKLQSNKILPMAHLVSLLPPPHFRTAKVLFQHLSFMSSKQNETSMNARNLSIVWSPNILRPLQEPKNDSNLLRMTNMQASVIETMITHSHDIFKETEQLNQICSKPSLLHQSLVIPAGRLISLDEARKLFGGKVQDRPVKEMHHIHSFIDVPKELIGKKKFGSAKMKGFKSYQDLPMINVTNQNVDKDEGTCSPEIKKKDEFSGHSKKQPRLSCDFTMTSIVNQKPIKSPVHAASFDPISCDSLQLTSRPKILPKNNLRRSVTSDETKCDVVSKSSLGHSGTPPPTETEIQNARRNLSTRKKPEVSDEQRDLVVATNEIREVNSKKETVGAVKKMEKFLHGQVIDELDEGFVIITKEDSTVHPLKLDKYPDLSHPNVESPRPCSKDSQEASQIMSELVKWQEGKLKEMDQHAKQNSSNIHSNAEKPVSQLKLTSALSFDQSERTVNKLRKSLIKKPADRVVSSFIGSKSQINQLPGCTLVDELAKSGRELNRESIRDPSDSVADHVTNYDFLQPINRSNKVTIESDVNNDTTIPFEVPLDRPSTSVIEVRLRKGANPHLNVPMIHNYNLQNRYSCASDYDNMIEPDSVFLQAECTKHGNYLLSSSCGDLCSERTDPISSFNSRNSNNINKSNSSESILSHIRPNRSYIEKISPFVNLNYNQNSYYPARNDEDDDDYYYYDTYNCYSNMPLRRNTVNYPRNVNSLRFLQPNPLNHSSSRSTNLTPHNFQYDKTNYVNHHQPSTFPSNVPYVVQSSQKFVTVINLDSPERCSGVSANVSGSTVVML